MLLTVFELAFKDSAVCEDFFALTVLLIVKPLALILFGLIREGSHRGCHIWRILFIIVNA